ncbi:patatin-like phospholipase domain-containing protein 4 [Amphiura filiformis]|uniref:patatin-like phospholipase domain-containing protein 4 n=1 Tax=Amphiura filiformis TaxID=82378 RepID=UPI003B22328F
MKISYWRNIAGSVLFWQSKVRSINSSRVIMTGTKNMEVTSTSRAIMTAAKKMEVTSTSTETWPVCTCCREMHSVEDGQEVNVSFAGCGFLGIYHLGVLRCFLTHGKPMLHKVKRWGGASAGALAAASIICIPNKLDEALGLMNTLISDVQGKPLGPLTPGYNMMNTLRSQLEKILPPNAHSLASGRLFLSATCITDRKNVLLSEFDTREELIQALLCSCYIPVYCGYTMPTYRGKKYIDGGLTQNMPTFSSGSTVCISPFSGPLQQICPNDNPWYQNLYGIVAGHSFQINTQNIVRGFQALFPPNHDILEGYNRLGWDDALEFLRKHGYTESEESESDDDEEVDSDLELE